MPKHLQEAREAPQPIGSLATRRSRVVDVLLAASALLLVGPILAFVAVAIALSDGGSPLFRQRRVGLNGREFDILKFRTMVRDAEERLAEVLATDPELRDEFERTCKLRDDPRVSRIGRWLRATGLDELPQLVNVLRGDMSLVGPRPVPAHELRRYGTAAGLVTLVRPGITGSWQISDRSAISYDQRVEMDCEYVRTKTLRGDLHLIARTGAKFASGRLGGW